jgi:hypothetical protein
VVVLRGALADGPIPWSDLRKRVPKYMRHLAESVLNEELAKGAIHRHPPTSARAGFRYALAAADIRAFAMTELEAALARLVERGFSLSDAREAFMHLLQEAEWSEDAPLDAVPHGVATETWYTTNYQHELTGG